MAMIQSHLLAFVFGLLGNIVSFMVYLAPLPTFYRIVKKKSTEEFQSIPYPVALFSSILLLYYGSLKTNGLFIITINSIGCIIESIYIIIYLIYATKNSKTYTIKLLVIFNIGVYVAIVICTYMFSNGEKRVSIVGWICAVFSVCVFAAPLSIMRQVIKTKSVEYMPFSLSLFLTICTIIWFLYGVLIRDYYVATPNVLGFIFSIAQMILYVMYKNSKAQFKVQEIVMNDMKIVTLEDILKKDSDSSTIPIIVIDDKSKL